MKTFLGGGGGGGGALSKGMINRELEKEKTQFDFIKGKGCKLMVLSKRFSNLNYSHIYYNLVS